MSHPNPILIIEDDPDIRTTLEMLLSNEGYRVITANHGAEALDLIRSQNILPSLIFLDLMMPIMDGRTFLREVLADPLIPRIPIFVLTAATETVHERIQGTMRKPFDIEEILEVAQKFARTASQD